MAKPARRLETVRIGEVQIVTCVEGEGPTLVMLPSYGRDGLGDFDEVAGRIAAGGWRVLRPQPRGVAGSTGPMHGLTLQDLADDIAGVIRHFGGEPAVVLGHAFGNFVVRVLAVEHPDIVRGVILAAATARSKDVAPEINQAPFVAGDLARPNEERLRTLRLAFFAPKHDPRPWLDGWYPEALAAQHEAVKATDLEVYWSAGTTPVFEINARFDPFKPQELWSQMSDEFGQRVTMIVIGDASHALFPEQPQAVAEAVAHWMEQLGPLI